MPRTEGIQAFEGDGSEQSLPFPDCGLLAKLVEGVGQISPVSAVVQALKDEAGEASLAAGSPRAAAFQNRESSSASHVSTSNMLVEAFRRAWH